MIKIKKLPGIYLIKNKINKKVYVGSSINLKARYFHHFYLLKKNKHPNGHLQDSFNKYGIKNFIFEVLCYCESDTRYLIYLEKKAIEIFNSANNSFGYNYRKEPDLNTGIVWSEESKKKQSAKLKGIPKKEYIGSGNPMAKLSDNDVYEIKKLLAETNIPIYKIAELFNVNSTLIGSINRLKQWTHIVYDGNGIFPRKARSKKPITIPINKNISLRQSGNGNSFYGKKHSSETKKYISEIHSGENNTNSKFTNGDVLEIKKMLADGISAIKIAKIFNVHMNIIYLIKNGKSWKHIIL